MRFHIGISKRVKLKTIISFLGALFLLILATLGIDRVNAESFTFDSNDGFSGVYTYAMTTSIDNDIVVSPASAYYRQAIITNNIRKDVLSFTPYGTSFTSTYSFGYFWNKNTYNYQGNAMRIFKSLNLRFQNDDFCDVSSYKSNDISLSLLLGTDYDFSTMMSLNSFTFDDIADVNIAAIDSNNDWFSTDCTYNSTTQLNSQNYLVSYSCPNVYIGSSNHQIITYSVDIFNKLSQSDTLQYNSNVYWLLTDMSVNFSDTSYTCSSSNPQIDFSTGGLPSSNDIEDALAKAKENYNANINGIDTSKINHNFGVQFTDLLKLPLKFINVVVQNQNTCTPYELDFSSLVNLGNNSNNTYVLTLPCMRNVLSSKLGNVYTIADILLTAIIFYNVAMSLILMVEAITSGVDLYTYFFHRTEVDDYYTWKRNNSKSLNAHVNHQTGEVDF